MNLYICVIGVIAAVLLNAGEASAVRRIPCQPLSRSRKFIGKIFTMADDNRDGKLNAREYRNLFSEFDANRDGEVEKDEFVEKFVKLYDGNRDAGMRLFAIGDLVPNNKLDEEDKRAAKQLLDMDKDGLIGECEFRQAWLRIADMAQIEPYL